MPLTDAEAEALGLPPAPKKKSRLSAQEAAALGLVANDDPTGPLAGGPEMSARDLGLAGVGQGAIKTLMGARDIVSRIPGLGGLRPTDQLWQEFNAASGPLLRAQRSDPNATVNLPRGLTQGMSPEDIAYVQARANEAARTPRNPGAEGSAAGAMLASVPVGMAAGKLAAPLVGRLVPAAAQGAVQGGLEGAAAGGAMADQGERLEGAAVGGTAGGLLGWLLQSSGLFTPRSQTGTKAPRLAVRPEAAALKAEGVPLTTGQMAEPGAISTVEQLSAKGPMGLAPEREAARQEWMRVAQNKGVAPGATPPTNPELQGRLDEIVRGYAPAYDRFRSMPADQAELTNVLNASAMPSKGVTKSEAQRVAGIVEDALTTLGPRDPMSPTSVGDLMDVREVIRRAGRRATASGNASEEFLFDTAEQAVTKGIQASMTPADSAALAAVDKQYARLMTAANAPPPAQDLFTPQQYLRQVERRVGPMRYQRGMGGDLQKLGENARTVFNEAPPTGFTPGMLAEFTGKVPGVGGLISRGLNTGPAQRFLFNPRPVYGSMRAEVPGATSAQSPEFRALIDQLMQRLGVRFSAAGAEENR